MRRALVTSLQVAITLGILWYLFRDPAKRHEMRETLLQANGAWLAAGIGVYMLIEIIAGIRWHMLLKVQNIAMNWWRALVLVMIGVFFNFFIPGGTGGDVVKVYYLLKETPGQRSSALLSVVVDRIIGLVSLVMLGGVLVALRWKWLTSSEATARYVWLTLLILVVSMAALAFSFVITGLGLVHKLPKKFPGRERLAEISLAYTLYGRAWRPSLTALVLSVFANLGYFTTFYCAARAYATPGTRVPTLGELFAIMPIINTITALPISLGGVGVREGLFQIFLGELCNVSAAVAVVISSTGYLLTMCVGLFGGILYVFYRPSEHARLRQIKAEVAALERDVAKSEIERETAGEKQP